MPAAGRSPGGFLSRLLLGLHRKVKRARLIDVESRASQHVMKWAGISVDFLANGVANYRTAVRCCCSVLGRAGPASGGRAASHHLHEMACVRSRSTVETRDALCAARSFACNEAMLWSGARSSRERRQLQERNGGKKKENKKLKGAANLSRFWPFIYLFSAVLAGTFSESPESFFPRLHTIIKDAGFHTLHPW